jgi:hypothetical protein
MPSRAPNKMLRTKYASQRFVVIVDRQVVTWCF